MRKVCEANERSDASVLAISTRKKHLLLQVLFSIFIKFVGCDAWLHRYFYEIYAGDKWIAPTNYYKIL